MAVIAYHCSLSGKHIYSELIVFGNEEMLLDKSDDDSVTDKDHVHLIWTMSFNIHQCQAT